MRSYLDCLIQVGFVVLSSVGAHLRAQRMALTDERTTKPDQVVNNQNKTPGFVVQIPEGLHLNRHNHTEFYPLILPKSPI